MLLPNFIMTYHCIIEILHQIDCRLRIHKYIVNIIQEFIILSICQLRHLYFILHISPSFVATQYQPVL